MHCAPYHPVRLPAALLSGILLLAASSAPAQVAGGAPAPGPRPYAQAAPPSDDSVFDAAVKAVGKGEAREWLAKAEASLARPPADRAAAVPVIALLLANGDTEPALKVYAAWAQAAQREDAALLSRLAGGVLRQLEQAPLAEVRARSLEARARAGDRTARTQLESRRNARPETPDSWESTLALARLGDPAAATEVVGAARAATGSQRVAVLGAFRGVPTTPAMIDAIALALAEGDDVVRDAAADAATGRPAPALVEPLRRVMHTARFTAPLRAAVALVRAGDENGRARVDAALTGPLPDGRLLAARAYVARPDTGWVTSIEPLLADANALYRIYAAELLMPVRPSQALAALAPMLVDENPVLRAEAMRVAGLAPAPPLPALRAGLGDANPWTRFHAAQALAAKPAPAPAAPRPR